MMTYGEALMMTLAGMMHLVLVLTIATCLTLWRLEPLVGLAVIWAAGSAMELFLLVAHRCIEES